jgi:general secretion pathway protein A
LVVDEAHRGAPAVWEEIHALTNQLGRPGGFASLILVAATELIRDLRMRPLDAWVTRVRLHLHLMPLDLDEARELLRCWGRAGTVAEPALEELHRDALGNPGRLLALLESQQGAPPPGRGEPVLRDREATASESPRLAGSTDPRPLKPMAATPAATAMTVPSQEAGPARSPSLIPTKPPIRLEEGLVEVGWDGDLEAELMHADGSPTDRVDSPTDVTDSHVELVEDRYAALQAWAEWTRNRERSPDAGSAAAPSGTLDEAIRSAETTLGEGPAPPSVSSRAASPASIRAESPREFAPYSQLFTRLRQSHQG